jgi:hypothetical protein
MSKGRVGQSVLSLVFEQQAVWGLKFTNDCMKSQELKLRIDEL